MIQHFYTILSDPEIPLRTRIFLNLGNTLLFLLQIPGREHPAWLLFGFAGVNAGFFRCYRVAGNVFFWRCPLVILVNHGGFATTPPQLIAPRTSTAFGAQSSAGSLFTGTKGSVWYNTPDGTSFRFHWDNPWAGSNGSESGIDGPLSALYTSYTVTGGGDTGAQMQFVALQKMPTIFRELWVRMGGATGLLGMPTGDVKPTPDGIGLFMEFAGGAIYSSPNSGTREIHGAIRDKWAEFGWEKGFLGYPVSDEMATPDGAGAFSHFQRGSIYWSPNTGAHEVHGAIRDKWAEMGWEKSFLGYAVSDEHDSRPSGKNRASTFQGGQIHFEKATGRVDILNAHWVQLLGEEPGEFHRVHSGPGVDYRFHVR